MAVRSKEEWVTYLNNLILGVDRSLDVSFGPLKNIFVDPSANGLSILDFELDRVKKILNIDNNDLMTDDEFEAILGNYLVEQLSGIKATGVVYFQTSNLNFDVTIPRGFPISTNPRFGNRVIFTTTESKTMFVASAPSFFNPSENVYEVAVNVEATIAGDIGNVPEESITVMLRGITGIDRVINKNEFNTGSGEETRNESVRRLKGFLKSNGILMLRKGLLFDALRLVEDASVIGAGDEGFTRDSENSGAVDLFVIAEELTEVTDYFRVGYHYLEDPSNGVTWIFENQPVNEIVEVIIDGNDETSLFTLQKDDGVYSDSIRAKDALFTSTPASLDPYFGKNASVKYKYNSKVGSVNSIYNNFDRRVWGRDLLVREATSVKAVITATITILSGFDKPTIASTAKTKIIDYVNALNIGDPLEIADITFIVRGIPGVDNVVYSDFRKESDPGGIVEDVIVNRNQYLRTNSSLVTVL